MKKFLSVPRPTKYPTESYQIIHRTKITLTYSKSRNALNIHYALYTHQQFQSGDFPFYPLLNGLKETTLLLAELVVIPEAFNILSECR